MSFLQVSTLYSTTNRKTTPSVLYTRWCTCTKYNTTVPQIHVRSHQRRHDTDIFIVFAPLDKILCVRAAKNNKHIPRIKPRNGGPNNKKSPYNDHSEFNFPRRKFASAKVFIYIRNTIRLKYNFVHYFLDTGDESVRSSRRLYTQRHIPPKAQVVFFYISSVGREKS